MSPPVSLHQRELAVAQLNNNQWLTHEVTMAKRQQLADRIARLTTQIAQESAATSKSDAEIRTMGIELKCLIELTDIFTTV